MTATTFGVIGSGWRSMFFLRLARMAPERLRVTGVVTRSADRGAQVTAEWGVPTHRSTSELLVAETDARTGGSPTPAPRRRPPHRPFSASSANATAA